MTEQYKSKYTGAEIDEGLDKANTALQPDEENSFTYDMLS